jgi:hypothetical protein
VDAATSPPNGTYEPNGGVVDGKKYALIYPYDPAV